MKMKKYTADTMVEAMKKVRADFGDDAVILSSNVVTSKGFLGFFRKKSVEVVAGFDGPSTIQEEPAFIPKRAAEAAEPKQEAAIRKEMIEMKKMLEEMKQSASYEKFQEELKPLLAFLEKQHLSKELIHKIGSEIVTLMKEEKRIFH